MTSLLGSQYLGLMRWACHFGDGQHCLEGSSGWLAKIGFICAASRGHNIQYCRSVALRGITANWCSLS